MYGISRAIEWANNNRVSNYAIISDSESSLKALAEPFSLNDQVLDIQHQVINTANHAHFYWTKAHVGTTGNEHADALAKKATEYTVINTTLPTPKSVFKTKLKFKLLELWQNEWNTTLKGIETKNYIRDIKKFPSKLTKPLTCFLTGHGPFPTYLNRFNLRDNDLCCCGDTGSPQHYLFKCPRTKDYHFPETRHLTYMLVDRVPKRPKLNLKLEYIYNICVGLTTPDNQ